MLPAHRVIGHREYGNSPPGGWPGRKTDPIYDMNWRRHRVATFTPRAAVQEDDMPLTETDVNWIADTIANRVIGSSAPKKPLHAWEAWRDAALKSVDVGELAAAIVAKLPAEAGGGLTRDDVQAAVRSVFADAGSA